MRVLLLIALLTTFAHAERRIDAHVAGGLEGGLIGRRPHPTGLAQVGLAAEWTHPERGIGIGLWFDTLARTGHDLAIYEENTLDVLFRMRRGPHRAGIGSGVRFLQDAPREGQAQPLMWGIDWIHLDLATTFARISHGPATIRIDGYFAWTFGCYLGRTHDMVERPQLVGEVSCAETMSSSYVVGLQLALGTR